MEHLHSKALALRYSHCPLHSELNFSLLSAPPPVGRAGSSLTPCLTPRTAPCASAATEASVQAVGLGLDVFIFLSASDVFVFIPLQMFS